MTIGEIGRRVESHNRKKIAEAKDKASYDYILASLITKGVSIVLGSKESFPSKEEVYPSVFADEIQATEEERQRKQDELSALRFKQFAKFYNKQLRDKEVPDKINE